MSLHLLHTKIFDFEQSNHSVKSKLECKNGCSKCCFTDISVFKVESDFIRSWFNNLSDVEKDALKLNWKTSKADGACAFLRQDSCTIYEARPVICRTQGLPLKLKQDDQEILDICPLNEDVLNGLSQNQALNLDLLNTILSHLEKMDSTGVMRPRDSLRKLFEELSSLI